MKKTIALILALLLCLPLLGGAPGAKAAGATLNLYTWAEMFDPEVLAAFEEETGITVNYTNFDYDETMLAKLESTNGGEYDLIIADDYIIETVIAEGLARKLELDKIPNFGNINPLYQGQFYDPTDEYTVPYGAGVQTIVYNPALVETEIHGYADLWNEEFEDNLAIIANYRVIIGMALKVLGYSYNTNDPAELAEAAELLSSHDADERARFMARRRLNRLVGLACAATMILATVVGLCLLFIPRVEWFWVAWVIGGVCCGLIAVVAHLVRGIRDGK